MRNSSERILTTHSGSLLRPRPVLELMKAIELGKPIDEREFDKTVTEAVNQVVEEQVSIGVDIPGDGDMGRLGYARYVHERLDGVDLREPKPGEAYQGSSPEDSKLFPEYYKIYDRTNRFWWMDPEVDLSELPDYYANPQRFIITGPIKYSGHEIIKNEIRRLKEAADRAGAEEAFLSCTVPTSVVRHPGSSQDLYPTAEALVYGVADALREEYLAVVESGLLLQVDYPGIHRGTNPSLGGNPDLGVEALNYALRGIPEEKVRLHFCSGSQLAPHVSNPAYRDVIEPVLFKVNAQAYQIEGANPRHEHEWMLWKDIKLPEGKILMPGVISHNNQIIEHPELVAWRIELYANLVGKENVIAGIDCGFSQFWDHRRTIPEVQRAKFQSLVDGAALASMKLWNRR